MAKDEQKDRDMHKDIKDAQGRTSILSAREEYKQKRLKKILEAKEKEKSAHPSAQSMEEVEAKPGIKEIRAKPLVQKDESIRSTNARENYI